MSTFERFKQSTPFSVEAGGILLGTINLTTSEIEINDATEPTKADKRGRFFFWRKKNPAQKRINSAWKSSGGTSIYLGEWHTHPEADPLPSAVDIENWKALSTKAEYEQEFLLFIIVGTQHTALWRIDKNSLVISKCDLAPS